MSGILRQRNIYEKFEFSEKNNITNNLIYVDVYHLSNSTNKSTTVNKYIDNDNFVIFNSLKLYEVDNSECEKINKNLKLFFHDLSFINNKIFVKDKELRFEQLSRSEQCILSFLTLANVAKDRTIIIDDMLIFLDGKNLMKFFKNLDEFVKTKKIIIFTHIVIIKIIQHSNELKLCVNEFNNLDNFLIN